MITLNLDKKELDILIMSISHCMTTCKKGGAPTGCKDCESLEGVMAKLKQADK